MQLGTRWLTHTPPPHNLNQDVKHAIVQVENELTSFSQDTSLWHWTLTYLENRPVVQLDDGTTIRVSPDGSLTVTDED
jgi:hypothetical protein